MSGDAQKEEMSSSGVTELGHVVRDNVQHVLSARLGFPLCERYVDQAQR